MLDQIISLSDLLTRQKTYKVELIDEIRGAETKIGRLYENVANGSLTNDEEAAAFLDYSGPKDKNYSNLKGRLFDRMLNSIFFIDQSGSNFKDIFEAGKNCYKNYAAIRLLLGYRKREVAINLALKTLKISEKYEFTDLNFQICSILSNHYLTQSLDTQKFKKFSNLKRIYLRTLGAEDEIREFQGLFDLSLAKSRMGLTPEEENFHKENITYIKQQQKTISSYRFNLFAYLYQINLNLEYGNFRETTRIIENAYIYFDKKNIPSEDVRNLLGIRAGITYLMLGEFNKSLSYLDGIIDNTLPQSVNWYSAYNYKLSLFIYKGDFDLAFEVVSTILNSESFEKTHPLLIQIFKIKEAYIHFLVELGKIDPKESEEKPLRKFRLNRFLNDVPTYSKDKRGVNISILIIQMLLLVQNKKHGQIIDKLDALNMYSHRYLRSDNTFRSNCFIKMLAKLPDADYHPIRWARYVEKYRKRLDEHPFELSYHNLDLEVIPFETLYDLVVEMLEKQKGIRG